MANRIFLILAIAVLLLSATAAAWILYDRATRDVTLSGDGMVITAADMGGPLALTDENGAEVTEKKFAGQYALLYFGYSFCPDVCPTGLQKISAGLDKLGNDAGNVVPVFISVDPERDTPDQLKQYTALFHDRMEGLTGTKEQIDAVTKKFRVYYALRNDEDPENYPVDHSSFTYLMSPDWELVAVFSHQVTPEQIASALKKLL
ncbi:MAG: SCO family protein [Hyphomicrobiales bacterium]